jgi:hypothetical protein
MATDQPAIQNTCDHYVLQEQLVLLNNFNNGNPADPVWPPRFLNIAYPVASTGSFQLFRFGVPVDPASYVLVNNSTREYVTDDSVYKYRVVMLLYTERSENPLYEANYQTSQQFCNKCLATGSTDDLVLDGVGLTTKVSDLNQLAQDVEKYIRTELGSNKYHPWVGSRLYTLIGKKVTDYNLLTKDIKTFITEALRTMQGVQIAHANMNSKVSDDEILGSINSIDVQYNEDEPSLVEVSVEYTSKSGRADTYSGSLNLAA